MGTSGCQDSEKTWIGDHPHAYGDKRQHKALPATLRGSSPRVWGQELASLYDPSAIGIIPTRMGTSVVVNTVDVLLMDHPHAYGDKAMLHT